MDIYESKESFATDLNDSDILVVAVKGFSNKFGMPTENFFKKAGLKRASKIIIWDPNKLKTLGGLPPDFATFQDFLNHLKSIVESHPHKELYITGTSGGAHTALLLGHLLKADKVVAFGAYPYLSLKLAEEMNDPAFVSFRTTLDRLDKLPDDVKHYFDLANVLVNWNGKTEYFLHASKDHQDYSRAQYLSGLPNVNIVGHPYGVHAVHRKLANDKALRKCFKFPYRQQSVQESSEKDQAH